MSFRGSAGVLLTLGRLAALLAMLLMVHLCLTTLRNGDASQAQQPIGSKESNRSQTINQAVETVAELENNKGGHKQKQLLDFYKYKRNIYRKNAKERQSLNDVDVRSFQSYSSFTNAQHQLNQAVLPQIDCPGMTRLGRPQDGGKWVCNPSLLPAKDCVVYSIGLGDDISFEKHLQEVTDARCQIYGFDPRAISKKLYQDLPNSQYFDFKVTGDRNGTTGVEGNTLATVMQDLGHEQLDILKIDVEGSEYGILQPILALITPSGSHRPLWSNDPITKNAPTDSVFACQILLEVHGANPRAWAALLKQLEYAGYWMFAKEINTSCNSRDSMKFCVEYAFIHETCRRAYSLANSVFLFNFPRPDWENNFPPEKDDETVDLGDGKTYLVAKGQPRVVMNN